MNVELPSMPFLGIAASPASIAKARATRPPKEDDLIKVNLSSRLSTMANTIHNIAVCALYGICKTK